MADETTTNESKPAEDPAANPSAAPAADAKPAEVPNGEMKNEEVKNSDATAGADAGKAGGLLNPNKLEILNEVNIILTVEIGRAQLKLRDLLNLTKGSIIELDKLAGEPVDVFANGKLIAVGNIITANGKYCVRLTSIPDRHE